MVNKFIIFYNNQLKRDIKTYFFILNPTWCQLISAQYIFIGGLL